MEVVVFITDGVEEMELIGVVDILRRAEISVQMASMVNRRKIKGANGITIFTDTLFNQVDLHSCQMIVLPGGKENVKVLKENERLLDIVRLFDAKQKYIGAICAAPVILSQADILNNRVVTCYPTFANEVDCKEISSDSVVVDEHIITAKSVANTFEFALTLVEKLYGVQKREEVAEKMIFTN